MTRKEFMRDTIDSVLCISVIAMILLALERCLGWWINV
jgi:hypothetical protein